MSTPSSNSGSVFSILKASPAAAIRSLAEKFKVFAQLLETAPVDLKGVMVLEMSGELHIRCIHAKNDAYTQDHQCQIQYKYGSAGKTYHQRLQVVHSRDGRRRETLFPRHLPPRTALVHTLSLLMRVGDSQRCQRQYPESAKFLSPSNKSMATTEILQAGGRHLLRR